MDTAQKGVARNAGCAALTMVIVYSLVAYWGKHYFPEQASLDLRLKLLAWSLLLPASMLVLCIGRLANHRFDTPEDIHGSGLTTGTERAKLLQAMLQNTLEQCLLALAIYLAGALLLPAQLLGAIPAAATLFLIGRLCFFIGYHKGAPGRAFGFGLTFYPTVIMLLALMIKGVSTALS
jgi:hypothetical protein